jgi:hypothetical protein
MTNQERALWIAIKALRRRLTLAAGGVTPAAHAASHSEGGDDEIDILDLGGYPNGSPAVLFLREDATWAEVPGADLTPVEHGNSGASLTLNWNDSSRHWFTLTDDVALTLSNPVDGGAYVVLIDTGAGGFTPTWPSGVRWPDDTPPDTTTASVSWLVTLLYRDDLARYIGSFNGPYDLS